MVRLLRGHLIVDFDYTRDSKMTTDLNRDKRDKYDAIDKTIRTIQ